MFVWDENIKRLSIGFTGALCAHSAVFLLLYTAPLHAVLPAQTYSAPTNVSIRFVSPSKVEKPVAEPVKPITISKPAKVEPPAPKPVKQKPAAKKVVKKQVTKLLPEKLNNIESASVTKEKKIENQPVKKAGEFRKVISNVIPITRDVKTTGRRIQPEYPRSAQRRGQEGVVLIRVLISENGKREDIQIHKPSRYALLNTAAIKAVKKWKFDPHFINGRASKSWVEIPIEFKLQ